MRPGSAGNGPARTSGRSKESTRAHRTLDGRQGAYGRVVLPAAFGATVPSRAFSDCARSSNSAA